MSEDEQKNNPPPVPPSLNTQRVFMIMKFTAVILIVGILLMLSYHSKLHEQLFASKERTMIRDLSPAPARPLTQNFTFQTQNENLEPKKYSLTEFKGQVVHINFWAKWCVPCIRELPEIEKLAKKYGKDKNGKLQFQVILINVDEGKDSQFEAKKIQQQLAPTALATYDDAKELKKLMNVEAIPFHIIVDKAGRTSSAFYTAIDKQMTDFKRLLLQLLAEEGSAAPPQ
jgi:thiol-disulfide isomerase/thioredoxin